MIKILEKQTYQEYQSEINLGRHANIIISDGAFPDATHYALSVGGLPLDGDLLPILEAREAELWQVAVAKKNKLTIEEVHLACYNSPLAGGWTNNEFQEAVAENWEGKPAKRNRITSRRAAIRDKWPL